MKQKLQLKGMDILHSLDQDLGSWEDLMSLLFIKSDLGEFLEDDPVKLEDIELLSDKEQAAHYKKTNKDNASFELLLMTHLGGEVLRLVQRQLKSLRSGKIRTPNGRQALKVLRHVFQGSGSAGKHLWLTKMFDFKFATPPTHENLKDGLSDFRVIHNKLCELTIKMDDEILGIKLASALPKGHTSCHMVFSAAMQSTSPTIQSVFTAVEQLIIEFACDEYSSESAGHEMGLNASGVTIRAGKGQVFCTFCERWGLHIAKDCYADPKHPHHPHGPPRHPRGSGKPREDRGPQKKVAGKAYFHAQGYGQPPGKTKSMKRRERAARSAHHKTSMPATSSDFDVGYCALDDSSSDDNENFSEYLNLSIISSRLLPDHDKTRWIADSGATSHMTHSSTFLHDVKPTIGLQVRVGNGATLACLYKGTLTMVNKQGRRVTLSDVLYVPGLGVNLLSIGKLQERGYTTTFPGSPASLFMFIKNNNGKRILSAKLIDSLYIMEMHSTPAPQQSAHPAESMELLHQRLGHLSFRKIRMMQKDLLTQKISITKEKESTPCLGCAAGKLSRENRRLTRLHPATEALEVIHTDISGPYASSTKGNRWLIIFVDEFTRFTTMFPMKQKSDALSCFKIFQTYIENDRKTVIKNINMSHTARDQIMRLQSDGGGEYKSTAFEKHLNETGIQHYTSCADTPSQNGIAERYIRSITETGFAMLKHAKLAMTYWPFAMRTAAYLLNRIPKAVLLDISPYQKWNGKTPDLRFFRTFGVDSHVRIVTKNKSKGNSKSHHCLFLGYREGLKGYVFQNIRTKRIITSGDAKFYEGNWLINGIQRFDFSMKPSPPPPPPPTTRFPSTIVDAEIPHDYTNKNETSSSDDDSQSSEDDESDSSGDDTSTQNDTNFVNKSKNSVNKTEVDPDPIQKEPAPAPPSLAVVPTQRRISFGDITVIPERSSLNTRPRRTTGVYNVNYNRRQKRTRSKTPVKPPPKRTRAARPGDFLPATALIVQAPHSDGINCPTTYKSAINGPESTLWIASMADELKSMHDNKVFGPKLTSLPKGQRGVSSKWVYTIKRDENGVLLRYKSRLVARGFTQRLGIDYDRTFAPVMKQSLLRCVLAEACHEDWDIQQVDIKTAFLYGELNETIYLKLPDGTYHLLQRAIYGLKQAGRQWYRRFNTSLENFGLKRLNGDPCCYHLRTGNDTLIAMIHVDDVIITGSDPILIQKFKDALRAEYRMTDLGPIKHCLGWEISRNRKERTLTICQRQYIKELLHTYEIPATKMKSSPASDIILRPLPKNMPRKDCPYLELLGAVLYIANSTRPDLSYAVSELSRFSSNPSDIHWDELIRILHYLNETKDHGLVFRGSLSPNITGFVDASYARCPITRKSRYGAVLLHSGCAIDWRSKMQTVVATSSMEAEYIGLCAAVKMACWLQSCMNELQLARQSKVVIGMDNQSAIIFGEEQIVQDRSKHIDIKFHYTREQIEKGRIGLKYVPTNRLPADMLTKPLPKTPMRIFRKDLGISSILQPQVQASLTGCVGVQPLL